MQSHYFNPSFIKKAEALHRANREHYDAQGFLEFVADTWPELLDAALSYLRGDILSTPYHSVPMNSESLPILEQLIEMNELGYLTTSSEPGATNLPRLQFTVDQRPYISGLMLKVQAFNLWNQFNQIQQNRFVMFLFWEEQADEAYDTLARKIKSSSGDFEYAKDIYSDSKEEFLPFRVPHQPFTFAFRKMIDVLQHFRLQLASVDFLDLEFGESYDLFDFVLELLRKQNTDPAFIHHRL